MSDRPAPIELQEGPPAGRSFWVWAAVGWGVIAFGGIGALLDAARTRPPELFLWLAGALLAHDLLIAPLTFLAARAVGRGVPRRLRGAIQAGLILTGIIVLASLPVLGGFGGNASNPTILPRDYTTGLLVVLATVWAATVVLLAWAWVRGRREGP